MMAAGVTAERSRWFRLCCVLQVYSEWTAESIWILRSNSETLGRAPAPKGCS